MMLDWERCCSLDSKKKICLMIHVGLERNAMWQEEKDTYARLGPTSTFFLTFWQHFEGISQCQNI